MVSSFLSSPPNSSRRKLFCDGFRLGFMTRGLAATLLILLATTACQTMSVHFEPRPDVDYSYGMLHRVNKGDCLAGIARFYECDLEVLAYFNRLESPYSLQVGDFVYIPPDNSYSVLESGRMSLQQITRAREERKQRVAQASIASTPTSAPPAPPAPAELETKSASPLKTVKNVFISHLTPGKKREKPVPEAIAPPAGSAGKFAWPLQGRFSRGFSKAWRKAHSGVDIAAGAGTTVRAARGGTILKAGRFGSYGNLVAVDHGGGYSTIYAHLSRILVKQGQQVDQGQAVGAVGSTGKSTGNHLHFELRYNTVAMDPEKYLGSYTGEKARVAEVKRRGSATER
jgi:murein DD-endopeptidase MepM/ murein hydrolase activator NlpD